MWDLEEFQAWKGRPETQAFLGFLRDQRDQLAREWADGKVMTGHQQAMAQIFGDIADLDYERDVAPFYGIEMKQSEDGDEV